LIEARRRQVSGKKSLEEIMEEMKENDKLSFRNEYLRKFESKETK
jgi:hypothetical protein